MILKVALYHNVKICIRYTLSAERTPCCRLEFCICIKQSQKAKVTKQFQKAYAYICFVTIRETKKQQRTKYIVLAVVQFVDQVTVNKMSCTLWYQLGTLLE